MTQCGQDGAGAVIIATFASIKLGWDDGAQNSIATAGSGL